MTQEQLLNMEHLKIAEVKPGMFVHVHAEDGYIITSWHDTDNIEDYTGSQCMWMPIRDEYDHNYRIITLMEHKDLEERHTAAMKLKEQNNQ